MIDTAFHDAIADPLPMIDIPAISGRGMSMLSVNTARLGVTEEVGGKSVWFELDCSSR